MNNDALCRKLEATIHKEIPISDHMGVKILSFEQDVIVIASDLQPNINIHGTAFAGSLYSICALAGWGLTTLAVESRALLASVLVASGEVSYMKPVQDEQIVARASFSDDLLVKLKKYNDTDRASLNVHTSITTKSGDLAVEFQGRYALRPPEH